MKLHLVVCILVFAFALALTAVAEAREGVVLTPDEGGIIASKDVGIERWSIQLDLVTGSLSGNVFRTAGDPAFVWCALDRISDNGNVYTNVWFFSCFATEACRVAGQCPPWTFLTPIQVPGAFFLPR